MHLTGIKAQMGKLAEFVITEQIPAYRTRGVSNGDLAI